ncbi:MAG: FKBP-type peptidyl-prolyl cis-trans isomerase [Pseudoxanthomonas sp.]
MKSFGSWLAGACLAAGLVTGSAAAQDKTALNTDKDKVSYAIGMDLARSLAPVADYVDVAALQTAIQGALAGAKPELSEDEARATDQALRTAVAINSGQVPKGMPPGMQAPAVDKVKAGKLIGGYMMGPQLASVKDDIELPVLIQALRTSLAKGQPLLSEQEAMATLQAFAARRQASAAQRNREAAAAFLSKNKNEKGVVTTPSGLQYLVLRQGSGARPTANSTVSVNYEGKLLDGTVFDSSYKRGEPAQFALGSVVPGWTEGLQLMPVGSKYRFWVPSQLGYGAQGAPQGGIGPDAMLTFDVELLGIVK